jgi:hypothetical protein
LSALACLQRYLGVVVVAVVGLALLREATARPRRLERTFAYVAGSLVPLVTWFARNYVVDAGRWTGGRDPAQQGFGEVVADAAATLARWAALRTAGEWTGVAVLAAGLAATAIAARRFPSRVTAALLAGFAAAHVVAVVALSSAVQVDRVGTRLLLPALPAIVALGWAAAARLATSATSRIAAGALLLALAGDSAWRLREHVALWRDEGAGSFRTRLWAESAIVGPLARVELEEPVHSNAPEQVWLLRGARGRFLRPGRKAWLRAADEIAAAGRPVTLVWFQSEGRPEGARDAFAGKCDVIELDSGPGGRILRIVPR